MEPPPPPLSSILNANASAFYQNAWGQQWPRNSDTIHKTEIIPITSNVMDLNDDADNHLVDDDDDDYESPVNLTIPAKLDYCYFLHMKDAARALGLSKGTGDVLVVLEEYGLLHKMIEMKEHVSGIVVTGQPGTGKTTFLLGAPRDTDTEMLSNICERAQQGATGSGKNKVHQGHGFTVRCTASDASFCDLLWNWPFHLVPCSLLVVWYHLSWHLLDPSRRQSNERNYRPKLSNLESKQ